MSNASKVVAFRDRGRVPAPAAPSPQEEFEAPVSGAGHGEMTRTRQKLTSQGVHLSCYLPPAAMNQVDDAAHGAGLSRSAWVTRALETVTDLPRLLRFVALQLQQRHETGRLTAAEVHVVTTLYRVCGRILKELPEEPVVVGG